MIEAGKLLQNRYRIEKQIGEGGMGTVYVATDVRFGSPVAIKETLCMDENFRRAMEREARLLNSLKHAFLPGVSDHFEEDNVLFLVMEYIPGEDLAVMLEKQDQGRFAVEQVLGWADQLLDALDYLHSQELPVIHRDIKPQNLKINSRGAVILLDFGLAKGNPTDTSHQTAAKSIFGYSRSYASLEQIQGTGTDPRSDLYSLAATLYHLLTGVPPEDALTRAMCVLSQKADPLVPASLVSENIPNGVAAVLQKAFDLNAAQRPESASVMRRMLQNHENYASQIDTTGVDFALRDANVFAQETKLMPESTRAGSIKPTEMQTELMPDNGSQVTSVRAGSSTSKGSGNDDLEGKSASQRGFSRLAAAVIGLMFVGVAVAAGLYLVKPNMFGMVPESERPAESTEIPESAIVEQSVPDEITSNAADEAGEAVGTEVPKSTDSSESKSEPAKNNKPVVPTRSRASDTEESVDFEVEDPDVTETVIIRQQDENGKFTTMRVHPKPRTPRAPDAVDFPPPGFFPGLTPEQVRKMQRAIRESQQNPSPTPRKP